LKSSINHYTIGWDIGGAHLKAVLVDAQGVALNAIQLPCELWKGLDHLILAVEEVLKIFGKNKTLSAITMTGELVDLFPNRHIGVKEIARVMHRQLNSASRFYAGRLGLITFSDVCDHTSNIASMNWHASAQYLSRNIENGLFVDIGSTTADMIPIVKHQLCNRGYTDAERMANNELIYTGVVRTPLMALTNKVEFNQKHYHVAAEYFATTADVYRLLELLPMSEDLAETADGKDKTMLASARRVARMIGHDVEDGSMADWIVLSKQFKCLQLNQLKQAMLQHTQNINLTIIGAGAGEFLVKELAGILNANYVSVDSLIKAKDALTLQQARVCFPAYAVARLAVNNEF